MPLTSRHHGYLQVTFQLLYQRRSVLTIYELDEHLVLLSMLSPCHMSGDECGTVADMLCNIWIVIEAEWQSEELKAFLRKLDILWRAFRVKTGDAYIADGMPNEASSSSAIPQQNLSCLGQGKGPRTRVVRESSCVVDSKAPAGLWSNCYNPKWLAKKRPHFIKGLCIKKERYNFALDMNKLLKMTFEKGGDEMDITEETQHQDKDGDEDEDEEEL